MQVIISFLVSLLVTAVTVRWLIRKFTAEGIGQEIREDGPQEHLKKRGTPTMGGLGILLGLTAGYLGGAIYASIAGTGGFTASGLLVMFVTLGLGLLGFLDDYIKLVKHRNLGLNKKAKLIGQALVGLIFAVLVLHFPNAAGQTPGSRLLSFAKDTSLALHFGGVLGAIVFIFFIYLVVTAWSNAVNLTDGLDGLAGGATAIVMSFYTVMLLLLASPMTPAAFRLRDPGELAAITAAAVAGCLGFLWFNAAPAKIFMGDTGSLALGGLVAAISVVSHTELLMVLMGILFVGEAASVVIQVAVFKTKGTRFFKMAPIHHHFEKSGWPETRVVVRFWLITFVACVLGFSCFWGSFISA